MEPTPAEQLAAGIARYRDALRGAAEAQQRRSAAEESVFEARRIVEQCDGELKEATQRLNKLLAELETTTQTPIGPEVIGPATAIIAQRAAEAVVPTSPVKPVE
jgi:hypothetical protein